MNITIIPADGYVGIDDKGVLELSMAGLDPNIHAIQFDGVSGHVEWRQNGKANTPFTDLAPYQFIIDRALAHFAELEEMRTNQFYGMDGEQAVKAALDMKAQEITRKHKEIKDQPFSWKGKSFYADSDAVQDIERTLNRSRKKKDDDKIPTQAPYSGGWMTADLDTDGTRVVLPMKVSEINALYDAIYDHRAVLKGKWAAHLGTIQAMAKGGATPAQIMAYDISQGWE